MNILPRLVLPAVATLGVLYPASFLFGMWKSAETGDLDAPGAWVNGGELASGWRYEVYERHFPKSYRIDMSAADQGFGSLCILEVRGGGPAPVSAAPGPGTLIYVTLEKPLPGRDTARVAIDLSEAMRARCAGVVSGGEIYAGGAAAGLNQAREDRSLEGAQDAMLYQHHKLHPVSISPVSLEPVFTLGA